VEGDVFDRFGALPIYRHVARESPRGEGSTAMLEHLLTWWKGKLFVLTLLGFAATDFIITITLSAADARAHLIQNPFAPHFFQGQSVPITLFLVALLGVTRCRFHPGPEDKKTKDFTRIRKKYADRMLHYLLKFSISAPQRLLKLKLAAATIHSCRDGTFSYNDTQLSRLGSPNFHEIPINRPVCPFSNNQRDAHMRITINKGRVSYAPSSLDGHTMEEVGPKPGFVSYPQKVSGPKIRERSPSFEDHYGQATLFWNSQTAVEKQHIVKALQFELSKVETRKVRQRILGHLEKINDVLAAQVAQGIGERAGATPPKSKTDTSKGTSNTLDELELLEMASTPTTASGGLLKTKGLSMEEDQPKLAKGRKVAILVAAGVNIDEVGALQSAQGRERAERNRRSACRRDRGGRRCHRSHEDLCQQQFRTL
jgi:hypothetical protein